MSFPSELPEWLSSRLEPADDGCWLWTAALDAKGYGQVRIPQHSEVWYETLDRPARPWKVHRLTWWILRGPTEQTLQRKCEARHCANPNHYELPEPS